MDGHAATHRPFVAAAVRRDCRRHRRAAGREEWPLRRASIPGTCPRMASSSPAASSPCCSCGRTTSTRRARAARRAPRGRWAGGSARAARGGATSSRRAINFYTSQRLYGPEDEGGTKLLAVRPGGDQRARRGVRRDPDRRPDDHRVPAAHQPSVRQPAGQPDGAEHVRGVHAVGRRAGRSSYTGGYITKEKVRDTESFRWMSNVAGRHRQPGGRRLRGRARGTSRRTATCASTSSTRSTCSTPSTPTSGIRSRSTTRPALALGAQYYPQTLGRRRADRVVLDVRLRPAGRRELRTGRRAALLDADRQGPRHAQSVRVARVVPRPDAGVVQHRRREGVGHRRQRRLREPRRAGAHGRGDLRRGSRPHRTTRPARRCRTATRPTSASTTRLPRASMLEGLVATFRYSWLHQDGAPQTGTQLRAYLNYAVRF